MGVLVYWERLTLNLPYSSPYFAIATGDFDSLQDEMYLRLDIIGATPVRCLYRLEEWETIDNLMLFGLSTPCFSSRQAHPAKPGACLSIETNGMDYYKILGKPLSFGLV